MRATIDGAGRLMIPKALRDRLDLGPGRTPTAVARLLAENFPGSRFLSAEASARLLARLAHEGLAGGSVYNAIVGATAAEHGLPLATRDRRAADRYRAFGNRSRAAHRAIGRSSRQRPP